MKILHKLPDYEKSVTLIIDITNECNMNCSFCFRKTRVYKKFDNEAFEDFKIFFSENKNKINDISFTGGEPLLEFEMIKKIILFVIEETGNNNYKFNIDTNIILLTDDIVDFLNTLNISLKLGVSATGERGIYNLIKKSPNKHIINTIRRLNTRGSTHILTVVLRNQEWSEQVILLHEIFPEKKIIWTIDHTQFSDYTLEDIKHHLKELCKVIKYYQDFNEWLCPMNSFNVFDKKRNTESEDCKKTIPLHYRKSGKSHDLYVGYNNEMFEFNPNLEPMNWSYIINSLTPELTKTYEETVINIYQKNKFNTQILTNCDCNLNCKYCYEKKNNHINSIESIKKYIKAKFDEWFIVGTNCDVYLEIIGGEPFLHIDLLEEITNYSKQLYYNEYGCTGNLLINISTNATLISDNINVQNYIKNNKQNISLGLSIDGTKEVHNLNRIDINGNGSYDKAIAGLNWLKSNNLSFSIKATFNHDTINNYAESVIDLINKGCTDIVANVVTEEIWNDNDSLNIANQLKLIIDYIFENNLQNKIHIHKINNFKNGIISPILLNNDNNITHNYCGCCYPMNCLGLDNKIYGCNRLALISNKDLSIKKLDEDKIITTNQSLIDEIKCQYKYYPDECKNCSYLRICANCSALPYDNNDIFSVSNILSEKRQCGFTKALVAGILYFNLKYNETLLNE